MLTKQQTIDRIVKKSKTTDKGYDFSTITNEEIIGVKKSRLKTLEKYGATSYANQRLVQIGDVLEFEYGIAVIPHDYDGRWKIVNIDERSSHVIYKRLEKIANCVLNAKLAIDKYLENPHISEDHKKELKSIDRQVTAITLIAEEGIYPRLEKAQIKIRNYLLESKDGETES